MRQPGDSGGGADAMIERRRAALSVLTRARLDELEQAVAALGPLPEARTLRAPEIGLVMVRGRVGGDGAPFNLGEATVTRAAISLPGGEIGHGHVLGRDPARARLVALIDALSQSDRADDVERLALAPIRARLERDAALAAAQTAATRVDFFTMMRGEP